MEDEIDLREYLVTLGRHWKLILGLSLLAALGDGQAARRIVEALRE